MPAELVVGKKAPAFSLPNQDGEVVKLADLKGRWVVLYFYPKDDTPGCTTEACEFTAGIKGFEKVDATVLGCSADSPATHQKFIAKYKLKVALLSDADHAVMEAYGAWGEKNLYGKKVVGVIRSTVIIDPQGRVAHHYPKVRAAGHAEAVRAQLALLRAAAA
jgi:peroxiredoxin Q/BCP